MLTFNKYGHLVPNQLIESSLTELEDTFTFNDRRRLVFNQLLDFLSEINTSVPGKFSIWVVGSFVTKKEKPDDLDCVFFVEHNWLEKHERVIELIQRKYTEWIDSIFVRVYPENHRFWVRTDSDRIRWLHFFSAKSQKFAKGFVQINFYEDENQ